ncbi:MAG: hypothetical protein HXX16_03865 [Bacteroidales bacterium]|nr:hypothetical protein [Bacteroidales bacterium]
MEVLVYSQRLTPRVDYAIRFIFEEILGVKIRMTSSYSEAKQCSGVLISYCRSKVKEGIHIVPHSLMIEDSIARQKIDFFRWEELPAFFHTSKEADIPFDLFAASFFLISRYEEYLLFEPDKHNRFTSEQSVASIGGFLEDPIVDQWAYKLVDKIRDKFPSFEINPKKFEFIPTIDIDSAFAYQNKSLNRAILGTLKSLLTFHFSDVINRIAVYSKLRKDPFDVYDSIFPTLNDWPNAIWFVLVGKYSRYDRNISIDNNEMKDLLLRIRKKFKVGIHPSYCSGTNVEIVREEISNIVRAIETEVFASRQHFLRIFLPTTYSNLIALGINEDYSMGYSDRIGFRAGTCTPFYFYNLKEERVIDLKIFPFQTMDFTLCSQMKLTPLEAYEEILTLVCKVKAVNGTFVSIWHNEYLSGQSPWKGWELLMPLVLEKVKKL